MANVNARKIPYSGEFNKALNKFFPTERSEKQYMKEHGIVHCGSVEKESTRDNRLAEIINQRRNKDGLKSKTLQELAGDARRVKSSTKYFFT